MNDMKHAGLTGVTLGDDGKSLVVLCEDCPKGGTCNKVLSANFSDWPALRSEGYDIDDVYNLLYMAQDCPRTDPYAMPAYELYASLREYRDNVKV